MSTVVLAPGATLILTAAACDQCGWQSYRPLPVIRDQAARHRDEAGHTARVIVTTTEVYPAGGHG